MYVCMYVCMYVHKYSEYSRHVCTYIYVCIYTSMVSIVGMYVRSIYITYST